ncbi:MAG: hypothetical protein JXA97_08605 [Anaerolineales bacterium]|nr:hypothetical protein [Anaerolineales bacterium]
MQARRNCLAAILALTFVSATILPQAEAMPRAQSNAEHILAEMTPEERVGQLFLVSYSGSDVLENEALLDLIENYHIGGVLLSRRNNNFVGAPETITHLSAQIAALQDAAYQKTLMAVIDQASAQPSNTAYVPLFIALAEQCGGGMYSQILEGMPEIPSAMALGATWDTNLAQDAGALLGLELESLGVNLYLGPSLDVIEEPTGASSVNLGTDSFGGDPYWVGEFGEAFIEGLHEGANGRLGVITGHFPGLGSSDRDIEEEVATIRKSLEQLQQIDLPPFFQVTSQAPGAEGGIADGLLTSHIRYQGFQGNIRATTRPISLDQQTYTQLLALEPLASWRANGGVLISDSLGSNAIRRFLDPTGQNFQAHIVARDAFLAGNDILILDNFRAPGDENQAETIRQTLEFFIQKYTEDQVFALRVDSAVLRILQLKLRIYGNVFSPVRVAPIGFEPPNASMGDVAVRTAQQAATLINPSREEIAERFSEPPELGERIVFFTDVQLQRQCSTCTASSDLSIEALEEAVLRFYGQEGARLVGAWSLQSYSFADLENYLGNSPPAGSMITVAPAEDVGNAIENADWIVFSLLDSSADYYGANALKHFLDQRPDLARSKQTIAFAFDIPFALDATDISKLDVYYGLYSSTEAFIQAAARLLFLELAAPGYSPVDIDGIGYRLSEVTSPAPLQVIPLYASVLGSVIEEEMLPEFTIGDVVHLEAGPILDRKGNIVPDGTVVQFEIAEQSLGSTGVQLVATTLDGFSSVDFPLDRIGLHSIRVRSDPAVISEIVQINVQEDFPAIATVISPTLEPTISPPPAEMADTIPTQAVSDDPSEFTDPDAVEPLPIGSIGVLIICAGMLLAAVRFLTMASSFIQGNGFRESLIAVTSALVGYNYLSLHLPGSVVIRQSFNGFAVPVMTLGAGAVAVIIYILWLGRRTGD